MPLSLGFLPFPFLLCPFGLLPFLAFWNFFFFCGAPLVLFWGVPFSFTGVLFWDVSFFLFLLFWESELSAVLRFWPFCALAVDSSLSGSVSPVFSVFCFAWSSSETRKEKHYLLWERKAQNKTWSHRKHIVSKPPEAKRFADFVSLEWDSVGFLLKQERRELLWRKKKLWMRYEVIETM